MKFSLYLSPLLLLMTALAVMTGCNGQASSDAENAVSNLQGKVEIDGSSTVYPITEAAADQFLKKFPEVKVPVGISGTGGGFKRFVKGETDISDASRPIKAKEFKAAKEGGIRFIEIPVAMDGLCVVVNKDNNWVDQLTIEQLQHIFLDHTGKPAPKWSDINPEWPDEVIEVNSPGTDSGTFDYFKEVILPEEGSFRADMMTSEDDNQLVTAVDRNKFGIGYFGASYYYENKSKLRAVAIVNPDLGKAVYPEPEHVIDGTYAPLSRPLFIYVNAKSYEDKPAVREFVNFYLEQSAELAKEVQYVALPDEIAKRAKMFVDEMITGTTYLTPDMEKRSGGVGKVYTKENVVDFD